jgi:hypothetical protein
MAGMAGAQEASKVAMTRNETIFNRIVSSLRNKNSTGYNANYRFFRSSGDDARVKSK